MGTQTPTHIVEFHVDPRCEGKSAMRICNFPSLLFSSPVSTKTCWLAEPFLCFSPATLARSRSYEFSEWALRRRALGLANLRRKKTHSTQTADSHFRRENDTQARGMLWC